MEEGERAPSPPTALKYAAGLIAWWGAPERREGRRPEKKETQEGKGGGLFKAAWRPSYPDLFCSTLQSCFDSCEVLLIYINWLFLEAESALHHRRRPWLQRRRCRSLSALHGTNQARPGLHTVMLNICLHSSVVSRCITPEAEGGDAGQSCPATTSGTKSVSTRCSTETLRFPSVFPQTSFL